MVGRAVDHILALPLLPPTPFHFSLKCQEILSTFNSNPFGRFRNAVKPTLIQKSLLEVFPRSWRMMMLENYTTVLLHARSLALPCPSWTHGSLMPPLMRPKPIRSPSLTLATPLPPPISYLHFLPQHHQSLILPLHPLTTWD